jgi:SpoVK/Ycf46/Vps4 family AAA+-type ATPase
MNTRQKRQRIKYKTHTDINNYNKFLLELDCKNKNKSLSKNKDDDNIDDIIKNINANYKENYSHKNFHGQCAFENIISKLTNDPNIYESQEQLRLINKKDSETINPICIKEKININVEINNINDLLTLINDYPDKKEIEYNINIQLLHKIKEPLIELNNMIGMKSLKENIVDQLLFYIQNLHTIKSKNKGNDFMHTVINGPPGTGKTEIAKIIGQIFSKIGILNKGVFKKVTRADLVAGYLGQTALKTKDVIKECIGGVLFIDEAYSLGNKDKKDSFSKECIDTLCESLSDHKDELMVIIAGYEHDLNECFFNYNQGLRSRFTWNFKTDEYTGNDLYKIFIKKVNDCGWYIDEKEIDSKWFEKNKTSFKYYGRDIETLFAKTKIAHSRRVFCLDKSFKKIITMKDIEKGFDIYLKNSNSDTNENKRNSIINSMYM